jgi:hypothetical protein
MYSSQTLKLKLTKLTKLMMKTNRFNLRILAAVCAVAIGSLASTARANVYATNIKLNGSLLNGVTASSGSPVTITFVLNEAATAGTTINVLSNNTVVRTITIAAGNPGTTQGLNTVIWDGLDNSTHPLASGTYSVRITAAATGHGSWTQISTDSTANSAAGLYGMAVNNNPASPYYGRVFAGNKSGGTAQAPCGIMKLNADCSGADEGNFGTAGFAFANDTYNPWGLRYNSADDRLYFLDFNTQGDLYACDNLLTTNQHVLTAANYSSCPYGIVNSGSGWRSFDVVGSGNNGFFFLGDNDFPGAGVFMWKMIGGLADPSDHSGTEVLKQGGDLTIAQGGVIMDAKTNFYIGQQRSSGANSAPRALLFKGWDGVHTITNPPATWKVGAADSTFYNNYEIALDSRSNPTYLAASVGNPGGIRVLYATNGATVVANLDSANAYWGVAWDAVGNLYGCESTSANVRAFSPPGANTNTTVAYPALTIVSKPTIVQQPQSATRYAGGSATFSVSASGSLPLSYQWLLGGTTVSTASSFTLNNVQAINAGSYTCIITNTIGSVTSALAMLTVLTPAPAGGYVATIVGDHPLAYWRLDETSGSVAQDRINGYNGQYNNVTLGLPGYAGLFDSDTAAGFGPGTASYVGGIQGITFEAASDTTAFSLEAWVNGPTNQVSGAAIITKGTGGGGEQFNLDVYGGVYRFFVRDSTGQNPNGTLNAAVGPNGTWQHVVAVYDGPGGNLYLYVNGALAASAGASASGILSSSHEVTIGSRQSGSSVYDNNFNGSIDEVAVYASALSSAQVQNHYNAQYLAPGTAPVIAYPPQPVTLYPGASATFSLVAGGDLASIGYQWNHGPTVIPGANSASYTVTGAQLSDAGTYSCVVTDNYGAITTSVTLTVLATNAYMSAVLGDNPVAYWRLDETSGGIAHDYWGANNGQYTNVALNQQPGYSLVDTDACIGLAPATGGSYVSIANSAPFDFSGFASFTLEAWANFTNVNGIQRLFSAYLGGGPKFGYGFGINGAKALRFTTYAVQDFDLNLTNALVPGIWYHLVAASDGAYIYFYVNGQPVGSVAYIAVSTGVGAPMILGRQSAVPGTSTPEQVNGRLDEAAIYNSTLSPDQVLAHYNASLPPVPFCQAPVVSPPTNYVSLSSTLLANAVGQPPLSYQWFKGPTQLTDQTNSTLTLGPLQLSDAGSYMVRVSNAHGTSNSPFSTLTVLPIPTNVLNLNLTNGLVLHLPFDGNLLDYAGRGNNGTNVGATTFVTPGVVGPSALHYFTDTNASSYNYVTLGVRPDLQFGSSTDFSVSYWVRQPGGATFGDLPFFTDAINSARNGGFAFAPYMLASGAGTGGWMWTIGGVTSPNAATTFDDYNTINDGNWHHLVHTASRTSVCVTYLDGVQVDSQSIAQVGNINNGNPATIGQDPTGAYPITAEADLDDLGVWQRVLTPLEVSGVYLAGLSNSVSFAPLAAGTLTIAIQPLPNGHVQLVWPLGSLQAAGQVKGIYTNVPGATSPWTISTGTAAQMYFRVAD